MRCRVRLYQRTEKARHFYHINSFCHPSTPSCPGINRVCAWDKLGFHCAKKRKIPGFVDNLGAKCTKITLPFASDFHRRLGYCRESPRWEYHSFRNHYILLNSKTIKSCNCNCRKFLKLPRGIIHVTAFCYKNKETVTVMLINLKDP